MSDKRFQECSPIVKAWRLRHYIGIPFHAVKMWVHSIILRDAYPLSLCWTIAIGLAQVKMNWVYDMELFEEPLTPDDPEYVFFPEEPETDETK